MIKFKEMTIISEQVGNPRGIKYSSGLLSNPHGQHYLHPIVRDNYKKTRNNSFTKYELVYQGNNFWKAKTVDGKLLSFKELPEVEQKAFHFGLAMFVSINGKIFITPNMNIHHPNLAGEVPVSYAGMIAINSLGSVTFWNNRSGHYESLIELRYQAGLPSRYFEPFRMSP